MVLSIELRGPMVLLIELIYLIDVNEKNDKELKFKWLSEKHLSWFYGEITLPLKKGV